MGPEPTNAGRYQFDRVVGSGGMGTVWLATDVLLGRPVAIKRLHAQTSDDAEARQRVLREARTAARLHHPRIVSLFDVHVVDGVPWLVMEYLPSESLGEVLRSRGPLPQPTVAHIGVAVAEALAAAHAAGVTHRDVKPGNVLLGPDRIVKLTDFGISRSAGDPALTATGLMSGTPSYLAPEVIDGGEPGPAADVWGLGATLFTAVEGHPPFGAGDGNVLRLLRRIATDPVPVAASAGPLAPVIAHLLDRDPARRPTAQDAARALTAVAAGAPPPAPAPPARSRRRVGPAVLVAALVAVLAAAIAVVVATTSARTPPAAAAPPPIERTEQVDLGGDARTVDPCSVVALDRLTPFGTAKVYPQFGLFYACSVGVAAPGGAVDDDADIQVMILDPLGPGESLIGAVTTEGPYVVAREPVPTDGSCVRTIALRDGNQIYIQVSLYDNATLDMCAVAEAAMQGALDTLRGARIERRESPVPPAANSLVDIDFCGLLDGAAVAAVGAASAPDPWVANWGCRWAGETNDVRLRAERVYPLTEERSGTPTTVGDRTFYVSGGPDQCTVRTEQRSFTATDGTARRETLLLQLGQPGLDEQSICTAATALMTTAVQRLPAPGP